MSDLESLKKEIILEHYLTTENAKILPLELVKPLITSNVDTTNANIEALKNAINGVKVLPKSLKVGEKNPFSKENFNLTQQGIIFQNNPELAKELMAAEGKY